MNPHDKYPLFYSQKLEAYKKLFKEYWYDKAIKDPQFTNDYIPPHVKEDFQEYLGKRNSNKRYSYVMFTINFKDDVSFKTANSKLSKCLKKVWIDQYYYCWEWREEDKGMHVHMKVKLKEGKSPYQCKREVYNTFKNLVGNKMHVNTRYSNREDSFINYINGNKKGEPKECMFVTDIMRQKYDIKDVYTNF